MRRALRAAHRWVHDHGGTIGVLTTTVSVLLDPAVAGALPHRVTRAAALVGAVLAAAGRSKAPPHWTREAR